MAMDNVTGFFLRKEVEELRKKGESWGLSNKEIDEAILRALGENSPSASKEGSKTKSKTNKRSCLKSCLLVMAAIVALPILLYCGVSLLSSTYPKFALYAGQMTANVQYPLQRMIRFLSLPIHHYVADISYIGSWECVVDNPLYTPEKPDCAICQEVKKIASRSGANLTKSAFKKRFYDTGFPVVIRNVSGYGDTDHNFGKFMEFYHANQDDLEKDACEFYTNGAVNKSVKRLGDLLASWKHQQETGDIIAWKICYGKGLRALRALFPRPYCIHSEGALDKTVYLLQPAEPVTDSTTVPHLVSESARGSLDNVWMAQVMGSSTVHLMPVEDCEQLCEKFEFTLNQGDIFFFPQHVWITTFMNLGSEPAMVFTSSFA